MRKYWLLGVLVILMLACNALTSPLTAPTPDIVFPTFSAETTSAPAIMTPTTVQGQSDVQPFPSIIARMAPGPYFLLGGTENGEWLSPEMVLPHVSNETYHIYGLEGPVVPADGEKPVLDQICQLYRVDIDLVPQDELSIGVTGNWDVTSRPEEEFPTDTPAYVDELTNWLIDKGFPEPAVEISQILRVDLEGDGTDEVLISASHFVEPTGHDVEFGDYSLVLMRKVVGDSVMTIPIIADYYYEVAMQFPLTYAMTLPADLNNDGVLEVLVGVERWEGSGVIVFEIRGTTVQPVFEALCGL
jgi:hypothetical protein